MKEEELLACLICIVVGCIFYKLYVNLLEGEKQTCTRDNFCNQLNKIDSTCGDSAEKCRICVHKKQDDFLKLGCKENDVENNCENVSKCKSPPPPSGTCKNWLDDTNYTCKQYMGIDLGDTPCLGSDCNKSTCCIDNELDFKNYCENKLTGLSSKNYDICRDNLPSTCFNKNLFYDDCSYYYDPEYMISYCQRNPNAKADNKECNNKIIDKVNKLSLNIIIVEETQMQHQMNVKIGHMIIVEINIRIQVL